MLVLGRKMDGVVKIGESIEVTVVQIRGDKVRLGIKAPREVPIVRDDAKKRERVGGGEEATDNRQPTTDNSHAIFKRACEAVPPEEAWVCTLSGKKFYPLAVGAGQIDIGDIAQGLSRRYRFGGQATVDYTVAQHSVEVSRMFASNVELALWGLLHDAAEAYLVDWQRPVKANQAWYDPESDVFLSFSTVEFQILLTVAQKFELGDIEVPLPVRHADYAQLLRERRDLFDSRQPVWNNLSASSDLPQIHRPTWCPDEAKAHFLEEFYTLMARRELLAME